MMMRSSSALSEQQRRRGTRIWSSMVVAVALAAVVVARTAWPARRCSASRTSRSARRRGALGRRRDARARRHAHAAGLADDAWRARRWTADELAARAARATTVGRRPARPDLVLQRRAAVRGAAARGRRVAAGVRAREPTLRESARASRRRREALLQRSRARGGARPTAATTNCAPVAPLVVPFDHAAAGAATARGGRRRARRPHAHVVARVRRRAMHLHADLSHNLVAQARGRKRWYLPPPAAALALYVAPRGRPPRSSRARPSPRAPPRVPAAAHAPGAGGAAAARGARRFLVADFAPGDVLYVPPGWFHQVETARRRGRARRRARRRRGDRRQHGVSLFSDSAEQSAFDAASAEPIPFERRGPRRCATPPSPRTRSPPAARSAGRRAGSPRSARAAPRARTARSDAEIAVPRGLGRLALGAAAPAPRRRRRGPRRRDVRGARAPRAELRGAHFDARARAVAEHFDALPRAAAAELVLLNYFDMLVAWTADWDPALAASYARGLAAHCFPPVGG